MSEPVPRRIIDGVEQRLCSRCLAWKPRAQFSKSSKHKDGLSGVCKKCVSDQYFQESGGPRIYWGTLPHRFGEVELKVCAICKQWFPLAEFAAAKIARDKLSSWCRRCTRKNRAGHLKDPIVRQKMLDAKKRFREAHPERCLGANRKWRHANPERAMMIVKRRQARRKGADGSHTLEEWNELKESFDNRCARCGEETTLERDHVVALTNDGSDYIDNIQPLCRSCNAKKGNKLGWDFRPIMVPYEELESMWYKTCLPYEEIWGASDEKQLGSM